MKFVDKHTFTYKLFILREKNGNRNDCLLYLVDCNVYLLFGQIENLWR